MECYKEYRVEKGRVEKNFTNNILIIKNQLPLSEFFYGEKRFFAKKVNGKRFLNTTVDETHIKKYCKKINRNEAILINSNLSKII